ncbi:hypothetical protein BGZ96_001563, partial [Linnemannia gamsii]
NATKSSGSGTSRQNITFTATTITGRPYHGSKRSVLSMALMINGDHWVVECHPD